MNLQVIVDFQILAESDDWLVVDKPAPLIVHPANNLSEPTLLGGIEALLTYEIANGNRPAIVNRLDRETSGVVLVAKNTRAARELGMAFERREPAKQYLAIANGWPKNDAWKCTEPILRAGELGPSEIWVRQIPHSSGKECVTNFLVERCFEKNGVKFSLIRCFPETGRMHQIRVHLAHSGHPIVGDKIYSGTGSEYLEWMADGWTPALEKRLHLPRHALHAASLEIPWNGELFHWQAPLPTDLLDFIEGKTPSQNTKLILWNRV